MSDLEKRTHDSAGNEYGKLEEFKLPSNVKLVCLCGKPIDGLHTHGTGLDPEPKTPAEAEN